MIVTLLAQLWVLIGRKLVYRQVRSVFNMIAWFVKMILTLVFGRLIGKLIK